jgi:hypothetical protein
MIDVMMDAMPEVMTAAIMDARIEPARPEPGERQPLTVLSVALPRCPTAPSTR